MKILKWQMTNAKQDHYLIERSQTRTQSRMIRKLPQSSSFLNYSSTIAFSYVAKQLLFWILQKWLFALCSYELYYQIDHTYRNKEKETKLKKTQRNKINSTKIKAYLNKIFDLNDHIFSCYISHSLGVMIDILNIMASIVTIIMDENHLWTSFIHYTSIM
jgi:hypothetical protein